MNTSKQVNVMIGLLFLLVITFGMYFVWDQNVRAERAADHQAEENAIRGGKLYGLNCRVCHGDQGLGSQENPNLPGAALNLESYRTIDPGELRTLHQRLFETIRCGRVGTLMPTWGEDQGGTLNNTQMKQLVALMTGSWGDEHPPSVRKLLARAQAARAAGDEAAADLEAQAQAILNEISKKGWEAALELAHEQDTIRNAAGDIVRLARDVGPDDTTLLLNDAHVGLSADQLLRLGPSGEEGSEVVRVVQVPGSSTLTRRVAVSDDTLPVESAANFRPGVIVQAGRERMLIIRVDTTANTLIVMRGVDGTTPQEHRRGTIVKDPSNEIVVERGAFDTEARPHSAGTQVFFGPLMPPEGPITGESGTPPCGQRAPLTQQEQGIELTPSPGQPQRPRAAQPTQATVTEPQNGLIEVPMQDNRFLRNNLKLPLAQPVRIRIINQGQAPHNLRVAGPDGRWNTGDDQVVPPDGGTISGGQQAESTFIFQQPGIFAFRCDTHPMEMWGYITVGQ